MQLSSNEISILNSLNFNDFISAKQLSEKIGVSNKTVYRIIRKINTISESEFDESIILSESGKGYVLNSYFINKHFHNIFDTSNDNTWNIKILEILFSHPKKKNLNLFNNEYLSTSTFNRRINKTVSYLRSYSIELIIDSNYIYVEGSEINIRKAINNLLFDTNTNYSFNEIGVDLSNVDRLFLEKQLGIIENKLNENITYPYDITIITHIYMILKRYREGKVLYLENQTPLDIEELQLMESMTEIRDVSNQVIGNIEKYLSMKLNHLENYFLFQNIYSSNLSKRRSNDEDKLLSELITKTIITKFYSITDIKLLPLSRSLYEDVYSHIEPMVNRIRLGINIENNILDEVKFEYEDTFLKLTSIVEELNKELLLPTKINMSEIGYLTLYFEKYKITSNSDYKVLLVCSTGIGTSELLQVKLKQKYPFIDIVATMSQRQLNNNIEFIKNNVNLIFTTIQIKDGIEDIPILNISPLLLEKDIQNINKKLKEI